MCGIAGIASLAGSADPTHEQLTEMCSTIIHRGPDDEGVSIEGGVGLGARRLAVIDPAGGRQPLVNETGTVRAVFNGEIYNHSELRSRLQARGHRFRSGTDGEVIVHLWEEHGPDLLSYLNGMFAIALHDRERRRVLLARDRLGIKPLYYARTGGHLVFGSEVKTVLASGLVGRRLNLDALGQFLSWEYIPVPGTLVKDVRKLAAGEYLDADLSSRGCDIVRWWDIPVPGEGAEGAGQPRLREEWEEAVDGKLRECVRRQLVSDVPLGAFLSGGVDSSLVVAAMGEASTFSIGFDDASYNELPWSRMVAEHLGVSQTTEVISPQALELFDQLMNFMDDPIGDFSIFPTYLVSRLARRSVTVALAGDGGDELFGGYETYSAQSLWRAWTKIPRALRSRILEPAVQSLAPRPAKKGLVNKARRYVEGLQHDPRLRHARWRLFVGEALRRQLFTAEALEEMPTPTSQHVARMFEEAGARDEVDRWLYTDARTYLTDNCLLKVDRMSMACSLEARVPLLDHELVELAFRLPSRFKVNGRETKPLLKRVAARHVPRRCVYRPKEGFSIPIKRWLADALRPLMDELLDPVALAREGIFQVETIERLKSEHLAGSENHSHVLWCLMVFEDWRRRWAV